MVFVAWGHFQAAFAQRVPAEKPPSEQKDVQRFIPIKAASEQMAPEEFRAALITFTGLTGSVTKSSSPLPYQIGALTKEEMQALYDVFPNPRTFTAMVERLASMAVRNQEALSQAGSDGTGGIAGIIGVLSPCDSFDPDYPSGGWIAFIEGILGVSLLDEKSRCDEDLEETITIIHTAAKIAATIAQAACDSIVVVLGEGTNVPFCVAAGIANAVADAAQFVINACQALDDEVDSAEIEAGYENTKIIIDALCCVPVSQQRKVQGCNGQDDDCDGTIDECDEDAFGPDVFVDPAVRGQCFKDAADALTALLQSVETSDDCGAVTVDSALSGAECDVDGSVTAEDDCGNSTGLGGIGIRIDSEAPDVTCSVTTSTLRPPNLSYTDVGFSFTAVDNCSGDLTVEVKVTSDEQTTLPPGSGKASPFPDAVVLREIDGTIVGVKLRNERGSPGDGRVYTIHVFATDQCGNVGTAACSVQVPHNDGAPAVDNGQYYDATGIN